MLGSRVRPDELRYRDFLEKFDKLLNSRDVGFNDVCADMNRPLESGIEVRAKFYADISTVNAVLSPAPDSAPDAGYEHSNHIHYL